jgi:UDP-N-acetylmuramate dehydrogenase
MMTSVSIDLTRLQQKFGPRLQTGVPLARYTSARVGGPAEVLLKAESANDLAQLVTGLWELKQPFLMLGGGSNVLVADSGVRGVVVLNRARHVRFSDQATPPTVWAESGANFGLLARQVAARGLSGLEWAAGIPGTLGGAVVGNAGAFGADLSGNLVVAEILHHIPQMEARDQSTARREVWTKDHFGYGYRSSVLKRGAGTEIVLSARLALEHSTPQAVQARMDEHTVVRHRTQPPGASTGSVFKNPPGNYAGRLIDAAGLKGTQIGGVQISPLHGNFFINLGYGSAADFYQLIELAQRAVAEKSGINLELEIQLVGEWPARLVAVEKG